MNLCECGCGQECNNRFVHGHHLRKPAPMLEPAVMEVVAEQEAHKPPPWPLPFDRRLFILAVERPGTPLTNEWRGIPCSECKLTCWTREETAQYGDVMCEECMWALYEELGQKQGQQNRTIQRTPYNPFDS